MAGELVQTNVASRAICADIPCHSRGLELTKLDLGHTGCDLNMRSREAVSRQLPLQVSMHAKLRPLT